MIFPRGVLPRFLSIVVPASLGLRKVDHGAGVVTPEQDEQLSQFTSAVEAGQKVMLSLTCDSIGDVMHAEVVKVEEALSALFASTGLDPAAESDVVQSSETLVALMSEADKQSCLPEVMTRNGVQATIQELLDKHLAVILSAEDSTAVSKLDDGYNLTIAWQRGTLDLAGPDLERTILFETDVEEHCPEPCGKCSRNHNSWRKGEEIFKFKCLLHKGQSPPAEAGLQCDAPKRRRSFWRPHRWGRKTWCTVQDWKDSTCRQLRVSARMNCGIRRILNRFLWGWGSADWGDGSNGNDPDDFYDLCVREEMVMRKPSYVFENPRADPRIPEPNRVAFGAVLSLGLSNGLAALRYASRADPDVEGAVALLAPFLQGRTINSTYRSMFNGTKEEFDGPNRNLCEEAIPTIEACRPDWKMFNKNVLLATLNGLYTFLFYGVWATAFGGVGLILNTLLLAAVGFALGGSILTAPLSIAYLTLTTSVLGMYGAFAGFFGCAFGAGGLCPRNPDYPCERGGTLISRDRLMDWPDTLHGLLPASLN